MDEPVSHCFASEPWIRCERHAVSMGDPEEPISHNDMCVGLVRCVQLYPARSYISRQSNERFMV